MSRKRVKDMSEKQRKAVMSKLNPSQSKTRVVKSSYTISKPKENWPSKKILNEREVMLIKRRMNEGKLSHGEVFGEDYKSKRLTPEQEKKGYDWLMNRWKTPRGIERKNNPFGYREESALEKFDHFTLDDFHNVGYYQGPKFYVPVYSVHKKDGYGFQYYISGGEIHIIG